MPILQPIFLDDVGRDLNLPKVLFLTGAHGVGKTTIAREIHLASMGTGHYSFANPLYEAARGMFFDGDLNDMKTADRRSQDVLPNGVTLRTFVNDFGDWMKKQYGEGVLGELGCNAACSDETNYAYNHFIFDDARRRSDINPVIKEFGQENCVLLQVMRPGFDPRPGDYPTDFALFSACDNEVFHNTGSLDDIIPGIRNVFAHRQRPTAREDRTPTP